MKGNEILKDPKLEQLARKDPRQLIEKMFFIVNKAGKRVPFIFNVPQSIYYENYMSPRDDILKARKEGFSSLILAILTCKFLFVPNSVCACVSHRDEDTKRLFDKVYYYLENLPFEVNLDRASVSRIRIKEMNTDFIIGTAGSRTFGRGDTIQYLHLSEFAHYPNWEMITGLMNAVPDDLDNTWIVKETTANGYGTPHHIAWQDEKRGDSVFKPVFFSWMDNPEYQMSIREDTKFSKEERDLQEDLNLTDEQLLWRQWKINSIQPTQDYTREDLFKQEFPATDTEAFLASGRPIFDPVTLEWYDQAICIEPLKRGELIGWDPPYLQEKNLGEVRVYKLPEEKHKYVIGGDTAEEGDYSALVVLDRQSMEQVALWWGHADEFELASIAHRLGTYYNTALVGIERNNMGVAVVKKLDELGYKNQYVMEILDERGNKISDKLGWETNSKTRPILISDLNQVVTERKMIIRSRDIIGEMKSFIRNSRGKPEAQVGTHDDLVIATGIAYQMYKTMSGGLERDSVYVRKYKPNTTLDNFKRR
jgi:hypothetical protein